MAVIWPASSWLHQLTGAVQARQRLADALDGAVDVLATVGVAEAQVALAVAAEGGAGQPADARVVQQVIGDLCTGAPERGHVGEGVEGAVRHDAAHAGDGVQPFHDQGAAGDELLAEPIGLVLRTGQRGDGARLREGVGATRC